MAHISTLAGITEVDDRIYDVTSIVIVGGDIDDIQDATFIQKDGGLLKFGDNCNTTFTRCIFRETSTAATLGVDNFVGWASGYPPRFHGTCTATFKGCQFVLITNARSDFDVGETAAPVFTRDEHGAKTQLSIRTDADSLGQFNHFASAFMTIDGLVVDQDRSGAPFEFRELPPVLNDLTILDKEPSATGRHVVVLMNYWDDNTFNRLSQLSCRNIAAWSGSGKKPLVLIDPVGDISKSSEGNAHAGRLELYRTYRSKYINATTTLQIGDIRSVLYNRATDGVINDAFVDDVEVELLHWYQDYGTDIKTYDNEYKAVVARYGFLSQRTDVTIQPTDDVNGYDQGFILLFEDVKLTETDETIVGAMTTATSANEMYDMIKYYEYARPESLSVGVELVNANGKTLDFGGYDLVFDGTLDPPVNQTGNTLSINVSSAAPTADFDTIETTGTITFQNGAANGGMSLIDFNGVQASASVANIVDTSRIQVYNITQDTEVANEVISGSGWSLTYQAGTTFAQGDVVRIRLTAVTDAGAYDWYETTAIAGELGWSVQASQNLQPFYSLLGVDGRLVDEYSLDVANKAIAINDPDGKSTKARMVAWYYYATTSEDGIRDFFAGIDLQDAGNAIINTDLIDLEVDNTGTGQVQMTDNDFRLYKDDDSDWVKSPSTGGYGISSTSGKVYVADGGGTGGGGSVDLSNIESALAALTTKVDDLDADVAALDTSGGGGSTDLTQVESDLASLQTKVDNILTGLAALPTEGCDLDPTNTRIDAVAAQISALDLTCPDLDLTGVNTKLDNLQTSVNNVSSGGGSVDLSGVNTKLDDIDNDIEDLYECLVVINNGVKADSLFIPHQTNLPEMRSAVDDLDPPATT